MTSTERLQLIEEQFATIETLLKQLRARISTVAEHVRVAARIPPRLGKKR